MTEALKQQLRRNGCSDHVVEFGSSVGIIDGHVVLSDGTLGPDVDVRWLPSMLRYAYRVEDLEKT